MSAVLARSRTRSISGAIVTTMRSIGGSFGHGDACFFDETRRAVGHVHLGHEGQVLGRLIHHARLEAGTISPLAVAVIGASFRALAVAFVGSTARGVEGGGSARGLAVESAAIAGLTDAEELLALSASTCP